MSIDEDIPTSESPAEYDPYQTSNETQPFKKTEAYRQFGRYRVDRLLGRGGYGEVYRAIDDDLNRAVAIKVTFGHLLKQRDVDLFLNEARIVASLDHPNIVPVFDVGKTEQGDYYVVSKLIEGADLAATMKSSRPDRLLSLNIVATIAEALHHAHAKGLVHRDVKPANILLDQSSRPFLTDFGIALRESELSTERGYAGTPAYMSPEQARGEGHRVDGRSDIYSLGVVLYELLTGRRPFRSENASDLLVLVATEDVRTPRLFDDTVTVDLERVCLKALSRRAVDRYAVAKDFAEDLRSILAATTQPTVRPLTVATGVAISTETAPVTPVTPNSDGIPRSITDSQRTGPTRVVPKGLRSFDASDSDFFLELLPGPFDREGLPYSLRFWKTAVERWDADKCFNVGLIYGPSGCGKSSLVKAGLLPRLSPNIQSVYVEATPHDTEERIIRGIRKVLPDAAGNSLSEMLANIRRRNLVPTGGKLLLVLDQFEQWLHSTPDYAKAPLTDALRQCDGIQIQAIVMVRDDFWLSVSRFLRELEVRILEGENSALVDLFDISHATKVLGLLGKAFGKLPESSSKWTPDHQEFLNKAIQGLSQERKVISVRLAIFADMMKSRDWSMQALREVGGIEGVGVTFLEETFAAKHAPPEHRVHRDAVRGLLAALLPPVGTDIKGSNRSAEDLRLAANYAQRPDDFRDLIQLLDQRLHLITPVDQVGSEPRSEEQPSNADTVQSYQLTHDYLVPSLREWLTRKQRETRTGRAELKLVERVAAWSSLRENKQLPTMWEWLNIRALTSSKRWTEPQRAMMRKASWVYGVRAGIVFAVLVGLALFGMYNEMQINRQKQHTRLEGLIGQLTIAAPAQLSDIVKQLDAEASLADPFLLPLLKQEPKSAEEKRNLLHAQIARVAVDPSLMEPLIEQLLSNKQVAYVGPIRDRLKPLAKEASEKLWPVLRDESANANHRFRAALALVAFTSDKEGNAWNESDLAFVANQLIASNSEYQPLLRDYLRPIKNQLYPYLESIFSELASSENRQEFSANAFADYALDDPLKLAELLSKATNKQFAILHPLFKGNMNAQIRDALIELTRKQPADGLNQDARMQVGQQRAGAAITLLKEGEHDSYFGALRVTEDPESLSQFVARCLPRDVGLADLLRSVELCDAARQQLSGDARKLEDKVLIGLLLTLGDYSIDKLSSELQTQWIDRLANWYANDPSSGVHGSTGWLLRKWNQAEAVARVDQTPIPYDPTGVREWFVLEIKIPVPNKSDVAAGLFQTLLGIQQFAPKYFTFVVFPPGEHHIGSPEDEKGRGFNETPHNVYFTKPLAVCDRELTWEILDAWDTLDKHENFSTQFQEPIGQLDPAFGINWFESISFCRWLTTQNNMPEEMQCYENPSSLRSDDQGNPKYKKIFLHRGGFRLPTEAEWEAFARAGCTTPYHFGNDTNLLKHYGWYDGSTRDRVWSSEVAQLRPSLRGLFDLHGNMNEWCHDWVGEQDYDVQWKIDPEGYNTGFLRVYRGGAWGFGAQVCRLANRNSEFPTSRLNYAGIRLVFCPTPDAVAEKK